MIERLSGTLVHRTPTTIVLDVAGVGYELQLSLHAASLYPTLGERYTVLSWLCVKEDSLSLYGFADAAEREVFLALISVTGIGPKMGQRILSETTAGELARQVSEGNVNSLVKLKGVGRKTAEMLVVQLQKFFRDWLVKGGTAARGPSGPGAAVGLGAAAAEAVLALVSLGVKESAAQKAVESAAKTLGADATTARLIAEALRHA